MATVIEAMIGSLGDFIDSTIVRCVYEYELQRSDKESLENRLLLADCVPMATHRSASEQPRTQRSGDLGKDVAVNAAQLRENVSGTWTASSAVESPLELSAPGLQLPATASQVQTTASQPLTAALRLPGTALQIPTAASLPPTPASRLEFLAPGPHSLDSAALGGSPLDHEVVTRSVRSTDPLISSAPDGPVPEKKHHKVKRRLEQRYYNSQSQEEKSATGVASSKEVVEITPNLKRFSHHKAQKRLAKWTDRKANRDPYPDEVPVPKEKLAKYDHGAADIKVPRKGLGATVLRHIKSDSEFAQTQAAKAERLQDGEPGFLEVEDDDGIPRLSQHEITQNVDVTSATKFFELNLPHFGPYNIHYSRNGRHMLLGGAKGHMAAFDWQTKRLLCEFNAMETVHDVRWLHQETLLAAAQKSGVYIYDNQGIELHALTNLDSVLNMEFLPYHFLLCTANAKGYMHYLDVSMGTKVAGVHTGMGRLNVMCQNPMNAIIHLGHFSGTVTMWSPNVKGSLVKMLCHKAGVSSVAVDNSGTYMATSSIDRKLRIWDMRTYKMLHNYKLSMGAKSLAFSQRNHLGLSTGNIVQIYNDILQNSEGPFLSHLCAGAVQRVQFCPFEDVLGVGHLKGFSSLIVPGSGEPNIDALEINPYVTKKQRANAEVHLLLDKIPPEMINLNTKVTEIGGNSSHSEQKQAPKQTEHKKLGKKQREQELREKVRKSQKSSGKRHTRTSGSDSIFDRFKKKE